MVKVKLMNEYLTGPVFEIGKDGLPLLTPNILDDDKLNQLNEQAKELYSSFFSFNTHERPCYFDEPGYKIAYPKMKELILQIKKRLEEMGNGSFEIDDCVSNPLWDKEFGLTESD
ncbi:MAG: hypothetical protein VZR10_10555 [Methanobrevibacter sp.]|jgi:hypothetical protein|nr:hypothetical protein [Methanobrevibacter sp.]